MSNLFVFTAGHDDARKHLDDSIRHPIDTNTVLNAFGTDVHNTLLDIEKRGQGFYAWGAKPGSSNERNWNEMLPGDWILCVYDSVYHYAAQVLGRFRNAALAERVWKRDPADGKTWEYMYFLTKPREINIPVAQLAAELHGSYFGFTKISDEKLQHIVQNHGSIELFIQEKFLNSALDLRSAEVLRALNVEFFNDPDQDHTEWWTKLSKLLKEVAEASEAERSTKVFQQRIWDDNPVSAIGQGFVSVEAAIADEGFREWLAKISTQKLSSKPSEALDQLKNIRAELLQRLETFCSKKPHLKVFRVLTAFFPRNFTTIADRSKLKKVHAAMFGNLGEGGSVARHANILHRLEEVLGPTPQDIDGLVQRITFPWYLYTKLPKDEVEEVETDPLADLAGMLTQGVMNGQQDSFPQ